MTDQLERDTDTALHKERLGDDPKTGMVPTGLVPGEYYVTIGEVRVGHIKQAGGGRLSAVAYRGRTSRSKYPEKRTDSLTDAARFILKNQTRREEGDR